MRRTRLRYARGFRKQLIVLHHFGCTIEELAREFEPSDEQTIRNWIAQGTPAATTLASPNARSCSDSARRSDSSG